MTFIEYTTVSTEEIDTNSHATLIKRYNLSDIGEVRMEFAKGNYYDVFFDTYFLSAGINGSYPYYSKDGKRRVYVNTEGYIVIGFLDENSVQ